jgi:hypothetical protein
MLKLIEQCCQFRPYLDITKLEVIVGEPDVLKEFVQSLCDLLREGKEELTA